ncbi:MAG: DUF2018 family protein [Campylobacteraceae bacterium]|jgi:L-2-hydroxyglutarate oxidase LhgO|nr:DUF2018 family protein [Campylobacteraceae bacterium]
MLEIDEDDMLTGSPRSKFFDTVFNANRNLVKDVLEQNLERYAAIEYILKERFGDDAENIIQELSYSNQSVIEEGKNDLFIKIVGEILSMHE